jgi:trimeric autotransporter adhesin
MRTHRWYPARGRASGRGRFLATLALLLPILTCAGTAAAQVLRSDLWGTNGSVQAMARLGGTLYIGGGFSTVGPTMGGGVPLDRTTGVPRRPFPRVLGRVNAAVPDGRGGWFIGGNFGAVDGVARSNLAHVLANGSVASWDPGVAGTSVMLRDPDLENRPAGVNALVLHGRTLYVGGRFSSIGGAERSHLAAVDAITGKALGWSPEPDDEVRCLALGAGLLYAGGEFKHLGGAPRTAVGAVELSSGRATTWDPEPETASWAASRVRAIAVKGPTVYVGGDFDRIGGAWRNSVAALEGSTGRATAWDAALQPRRMYIAHGDWQWPAVTALAVEGYTLFLGGWFEQAGGAPRAGLAALDTRTGRAGGFDAQVQGGSVLAMALHGRTLYVAGALYDIGGAVRPNLAALDAGTGRATAWNPRADGVANAIAVDGDAVFAGGSFTCVHDWQVRYGVAALDLATGGLLPWDAHLDGGLWTLAVMDNTLYMAGPFRTVGGQTRGNIAAVDATTGAVLPWNPGTVGLGYPTHARLAAANGRVYLAGSIALADGRSNTGFVALDGATGAVPTWASVADGVAEDVLPAGDTLYVAGHFIGLDGLRRVGLGALDAASGQVLPWAPEVAGGPESAMFADVLARRGDTLYVGGSLGSVNGVARSDLAAVDARTGAVLPWDPDVQGVYSAYNDIHVKALAAHGNTVWAGGKFASVHGLPRPYLVAMDATTGIPTAWEPKPDGQVFALLACGDTLYVGGSFRGLGLAPCASLAAVVLPSTSAWQADAGTPRPPAPGRDARLIATPNPVRAGAPLRLAFPPLARGALAVYDIQGRRVATVADALAQSSGDRVVTLSTTGWKPGLYLCRLEGGGTALTRKLVVTP